MPDSKLALMTVEHLQCFGLFPSQRVHLREISLYILTLDKDGLALSSPHAQLWLEHPHLILRFAAACPFRLLIDEEKRHYPAIRCHAHTALQQHQWMIGMQRPRCDSAVFEREGQGWNYNGLTLPD